MKHALRVNKITINCRLKKTGAFRYVKREENLNVLSRHEQIYSTGSMYEVTP